MSRSKQKGTAFETALAGYLSGVVGQLVIPDSALQKWIDEHTEVAA